MRLFRSTRRKNLLCEAIASSERPKTEVPSSFAKASVEVVPRKHLLIYKQSSGEPVFFNIFLSGASCRTCVVSGKAPTSCGSVFGSRLAGHGDFIASRKMFEGNWSAEVRQDGLRRGDRLGPEGGWVYNLLFFSLSSRSLRRAARSRSSPRRTFCHDPVIDLSGS
jgi:hypothetical protein